MIIVNNALYSIGTLNGGWYSLNSPGNEIRTTNNNSFATYDVCGNGYTLSQITIDSLSANVTHVAPWTLTLNKFNNGVTTGDSATTLSFTISANHALNMSLLLNPAAAVWANSARATLAVPFVVPAGAHTNSSISVDLSAADVLSDPETRRLVTLGYIG